MLLRWLVNQYVGQTARQKLQEVVVETLRGRRTGAGGQESGGRGQEPGGRGQEPGARGQEPGSGAQDEEQLAPPCDLAVVFALGIESGGTVDLLEKASTARVGTFTEHAGTLRGKEAVVVESGVGSDAAAKATADIIDFHRPLWVVSAGFAGALDGSLRKGHMLLASEVVRPDREPLSIGLKMDETPGVHVGRLLTTDKLIRTKADKESLARQHRALACDMETYAIAEVCRQQQVRFLSVRIISDALEDELPKEVERLLAQKTLAGKLGAAAQAVFKRPGSAMDFLKLQDDALKASDRLARFLGSLVGQLGA